MKRIVSIALALCMLLSCAVIFGGCSSENTKDWPVTVRGVTIDKEPENIVVLNDCFADIIAYIGYHVKMVGRSDSCDQEALYIVPSVGSSSSPDVNAITSAQTDLVIADSTLSPEAKANIEAGGAKVLTLDVPTTENALRELYIDLGTALGGNSTGKAKGEDGYDDLLDMLGNMNTAASEIAHTVAYLYLDESGQLCTFVKGTLEYKFFNYNGNPNVFANQAEPAVNTQELRIGSPNYIFYDSEDVLTVLAADEQFANLNALKNNRTLMIPKKSFERYGISAEQAVFDMLSYIEKDNKATPDEATPDSATSAATEAAPADITAPAPTRAKETAAAEAPTQADAQDDGVITYSYSDNDGYNGDDYYSEEYYY